MTRLPHLRMIIDSEPNSGSWNMAVDEVLLLSAIESGVATLRWYRWCEPTVSLGYFQSEDAVATDPLLSGLPRVRRLSGGGALVHDRELTYSLALPASQRVAERPVDLYKVVHQAFIDALQSLGVELAFRGQTTKLPTEPLLCFARQDEHDLVLGAHKVLGSAQRRRRGAILQHGGFLLQASPVTPDVLGVYDLAEVVPGQEIARLIGSMIAQRVAEKFDFQSLVAEETRRARELCGM